MSKMTNKTAATWIALGLVLASSTACAVKGGAGPTMSDIGAPATDDMRPDIVQSGGGGAWKSIADKFPGAARIFGITAGPDGDVWFTDYDRSSIGRISMSGKVTEFTTPTANSLPYAITAGPDGALWFTEQGSSNQIGRITTSGSITEFSTTIGGTTYHPGNGIVLGPDHDLWFTAKQSTAIIRSTAAGVMTVFSNPNLCAGNRITVGSDNELWFTTTCLALDKLSTAGIFTQYALPNNEQGWDITSASDGDLYFNETQDSNLGKITTSGAVTLITSPQFVLQERGLLAVGNQVWFVAEGAKGVNEIGRLNVPSDTFASPLVPGPSSLQVCCSWYFANGPDGNVWFTVDAQHIGVHIERAMRLSPRSATLGIGAKQTITVSEKQYGGSWTASTSNPEVATVKQGTMSDQFVVTARATGTCKITIKDDSGNSAAATITVM